MGEEFAEVAKVEPVHPDVFAQSREICAPSSEITVWRYELKWHHDPAVHQPQLFGQDQYKTPFWCLLSLSLGSLKKVAKVEPAHPDVFGPSWQWHRTGSRWFPVRILPVAPLWCDLGFVPNSCGNKAGEPPPYERKGYLP